MSYAVEGLVWFCFYESPDYWRKDSCITSFPSSLSNMTFNMAYAKQVIIRVKKNEENSRKYDYRIVSHGTMEQRQLFHKDTGLSNAANHCLVWRCYFIFLFWLLSSFLSCSSGSDCFRTLTNDYGPTSLAFW